MPLVPLVILSLSTSAAPPAQDGDGLDSPSAATPPKPAPDPKKVAAQQKVYLARFETAATKIADERIKKPAAKKELQELRQKVLGVSRDRNITLDRIEQFADPARKRLEEMLTLRREDVMKADPALAAEREALLKDGESEAELAEAENRAAVVCALPDPKDRKVIAANAELAKKLEDPAEARGVFLLNVLRSRVGIGALTLDLKLCDAARGHSKDMSEQNFFDHISPVPGKAEPWDRAKLAGTTANAENIYQGGERGEDAIEGWWHSPPHHLNMMAADRMRVGMGRHEGYWTQMFGG
jgi:uncharacterized protein YkwD